MPAVGQALLAAMTGRQRRDESVPLRGMSETSLKLPLRISRPAWQRVQSVGAVKGYHGAKYKAVIGTPGSAAASMTGTEGAAVIQRGWHIVAPATHGRKSSARRGELTLSTRCGPRGPDHQQPQCSVCCRWVQPCGFPLTVTKRLLGTATGAGPSGGCMRYCGHRVSATRLAPRHRPLPQYLHWRYRPAAVIPNSPKMFLQTYTRSMQAPPNRRRTRLDSRRRRSEMLVQEADDLFLGESALLHVRHSPGG